MFSPELMSYLIKYQNEETSNEGKKYIELKNGESFFGLNRFTKFATVPIAIRVKR